MRKMFTRNPKIPYYVKGDDPKLLIHTGTHGDESEVIDYVIDAVIKYEDELPDFIFVPIVSPSAVTLKTRKNIRGNDLNRQFFSNSDDPEVKANIEIVKDKKFELFLSIHEDWEYPQYYLYDWGYSQEDNKLILEHNRFLKEHGVGLFNGIDDLNDPSLGYKFTDGYNKSVHIKKDIDDGIISDWVLNREIAKDYFLPEIPQSMDKKTKIFVIDTFFREVVIKYFKKS